MITQIELGDIIADVEFKNIKNIHLSVYPPNGRVRIAAPSRMDVDTIRIYAISKLAWIKQQQKRFLEQSRETAREYIERESHYVWGNRYLMEIVEYEGAPLIELGHHQIILRVRPGTDAKKKQAIMEEWYRQQLKRTASLLIAKWEQQIGVKVGQFFVQRMKTRWGSCNHQARNIRLNTDLAKKPPACLEYVIVHEMVHLLEPTHNTHFVALMDQYMPNWKHLRDELNRAPLGHVDWAY